MGRAGRAWVEAEWGWDSLGERMASLLRPPAAPGQAAR
jgi:hypothetical protein